MMNIIEKVYFIVLFGLYLIFGFGAIVTNQWDTICTIGSVIMFTLLVCALVLNYKIKKLEEEP